MMDLLEEKLTKIIREHLEDRSLQFESTATFDELGCTSLDCLEIVLKVEEAFQIEIPDDDIDAIKTPENLRQYIAARLPPTGLTS